MTLALNKLRHSCCSLAPLAKWLSCTSINKVVLRRSRLVQSRVTLFGQANHLQCNQLAIQVNSFWPCLCG